MCGIAGAFSRADARATVAKMDACLAHRGPDDAGLMALTDGVGLAGTFAHRRLAILDVSAAGHQPMSTPDGRWTITFNGEIYNFRELRESLAQEGVRFITGTDTEVILHGVARHGRAFFARLRGMFAFALWDHDVGIAYLVRDPLGIKPLFVTEVNGTLLFASELRAILASGLVPRKLSRDAVSSFLRYGSASEPQTMIERVLALPPGTLSVVELTRDAAVLRGPEHYDLDPARDSERITDRGEATQRIRDALRDSVKHHLVSDVPVGLFLSGGIDSSALAGLAHEVSTAPLDSFTIAFREQAFSEARMARDVARRFGARHHEVTMSGADMLAMLPDAFAVMDQPSMDGLNTYAISRAAQSFGVKVVMSGLGGDELFGGYPSFHRAAMLHRLRVIPAVARRGAAAVVPRGGVRGEKLRLLAMDGDAASNAYRASRVLFTSRQIVGLCGLPPDDRLRPPAAGTSLFSRVSWYEVTGYMLNTLLRDSDVFSMACSLELRVPFLDREVMKVCASIDEQLWSPSEMNKPLLVDAVRDLLPTAVWDRPKQGFTLPFAHWLRDELRDETTRTLTDEAFARVGLEPAAGRAVWSEFLGGGAMTWSRPWSLFTLLRWAQEHDVSVGDIPLRAGREAELPNDRRSSFPPKRSPVRAMNPVRRSDERRLERIHLWSPGMFGFKGGIQVYQHDLMHALRTLVPSARIHVFSKNDATVPPLELGMSGMDFHCAGTLAGPLRTARFVSQIMSYGLADRPDLVVVGHLNFAGAALALERAAGVPYWIVAYGIEAWDLRQPILRRALHGAERIISISEHTRRRLIDEQGIDPSRIVLLAPTFDEAAFTPAPKPRYLLDRYGLTPEQPVILTVARLAGAERYKGYDQIFAALKTIRDALPGVRYLLAGTGDDRQRVEAMIAHHGIADNVTLAGFVPDRELCDHYNLCNVFAMPSKREGFGIVFVEAMACGKPVLAGNQDGAVDALQGGEFGALEDPDDVGAIARRLVALLRGDYPAPLMDQPARLREAVVARFGPSQFLHSLQEHLHAMTAAPHG